MRLALFVLGVIGLKLLLVADNEIISTQNDSVNYALESTTKIGSIGGPMGYPYWAALCRLWGFPQRIAIEALFLGACFAVSAAVRKSGGGWGFAATFFLLAFLPATYFLFDNALSDGFFTCLVLLALALSMRELATEGESLAAAIARRCLLAGTMGWMFITRNEDLLVFGWIIWLAACKYLTRWHQQPRSARTYHAAGLAVALSAAALLVPGGVAGFHWISQGVFARTLMTMPSHMALLENLAAIQTGTAPALRIPISQSSRTLAYAASPTLGKLQAIIEDPQNMYQKASREAGLAGGEIGSGWILHVFNDAALQVIHPQTLQNLDAFYRNCNAELDAAFDQGRLARKWVLHPVLGGNAGQIAAQAARSLPKLYRYLFAFMEQTPDAGIEPQLFDAAFLRRSALVPAQRTAGLVQGWAFAQIRGVRVNHAQVGVFSGSNGINSAMWFDAEATERPDVAAAFPDIRRQQWALQGFRCELPAVTGNRIAVRFFLSNGVAVTAVDPVANHVAQLSMGQGNPTLVEGFDSLPGPSGQSRPGWRFEIQDQVATFLSTRGPRGFALIALALVAVTAFRFLRKRAREPMAGTGVVLLFALGLLLQRIGFYAVVDAGGWDVEIRYLLPASCMTVVVTSLAIAWIATDRR